MVVPVLVYGCETWKMNKGDRKMIDVFNNKCLRRIMKVRWEDHVSTEELLKQANCRSLSSDVKQRKWKMIGHILRQDRYNLMNVVMTWAPEGKRQKQHGAGQWRKKGSRLDGDHETRREARRRQVTGRAKPTNPNATRFACDTISHVRFLHLIDSKRKRMSLNTTVHQVTLISFLFGLWWSKNFRKGLNVGCRLNSSLINVNNSVMRLITITQGCSEYSRNQTAQYPLNELYKLFQGMHEQHSRVITSHACKYRVYVPYVRNPNKSRFPFTCLKFSTSKLSAKYCMRKLKEVRSEYEVAVSQRPATISRKFGTSGPWKSLRCFASVDELYHILINPRLADKTNIVFSEHEVLKYVFIRNISLNLRRFFRIPSQGASRRRLGDNKNMIGSHLPTEPITQTVQTKFRPTFCALTKFLCFYVLSVSPRSVNRSLHDRCHEKQQKLLNFTSFNLQILPPWRSVQTKFVVCRGNCRNGRSEIGPPVINLRGFQRRNIVK
ncbi:Hypothetical predicted protein, partial [Paramuricea clavata]